MIDPEFKRAIEEIKLRAPIEEIVRQRVPELRQRGKLYEACCPFHEEKTPSFKVDPARGTWRCYGACGDGGDVLSFAMVSYGIGFKEAAEMLAAQTGVELPKFGGQRQDSDEYSKGFEVLKGAAAYYQERLGDPEAAEARNYLKERGFDQETNLKFGLGWAPAAGEAFVQFSKSKGDAFEVLEKTGLARRNEQRGGHYDFFRGRLLFPIRDLQGRTVGFGARRLSDGPNAGPKYINSPESDWFHKGTLVYGLDLAVKASRKSRHLVLMEGYTDVIAAHQKGLPNTAAVLGTSTTEQHAKLLKRSGAQRISLVFDGDNAGREAAFKALHGLLPEDYDMDVVQPPGGQDPCDVLMSQGLKPFEEALEGASAWFDFVCEGLDELHGNALSQAVDRVLSLILRVKAPVHRQDLVRRLSERLGMSLETLQDQLMQTPEARVATRDAERRRQEKSSQASVEAQPSEESMKPSGRQRIAWGEIAGALLLDPSLVPMAGECMQRCPFEDIQRILGAIAGLHADLDAEINVDTVMTELGDDPARGLIGKILHHAEPADSPKALLDGAMHFLERTERERERDDIHKRLLAEETSESDRKNLLRRLRRLFGDDEDDFEAGAPIPIH